MAVASLRLAATGVWGQAHALLGSVGQFTIFIGACRCPSGVVPRNCLPFAIMALVKSLVQRLIGKLIKC